MTASDNKFLGPNQRESPHSFGMPFSPRLRVSAANFQLNFPRQNLDRQGRASHWLSVPVKVDQGGSNGGGGATEFSLFFEIITVR